MKLRDLNWRRFRFEKPYSRGFTIVEMVIVLGLILVFLLGTAPLFYMASKSSTQASHLAQARALVKEGMETVIAIRDAGGAEWNWSTTPSNTSGSEYYQPYLSGSSWVLGNKSSVSPVPTLSPPFTGFTRKVKIEQVQRGIGCGSTVCPIVLSGGVVDTNTRKVTVTLEWREEDGVKQLPLSTYLIHWR